MAFYRALNLLYKQWKFKEKTHESFNAFCHFRLGHGVGRVGLGQAKGPRRRIPSLRGFSFRIEVLSFLPSRNPGRSCRPGFLQLIFMAPKNEVNVPAPSGVYHTMAQTTDGQNVSQRLSEFQDLKQDPTAPILAGYMLLKPIGQGAYAQVWEGIQIRTRKFVAVKIFTKKNGVHWFFLQREADRLLRLDKHPHIVSMLDADLGGEVPYYVMDLAQEGSLERFIQNRNKSDEDGADVGQAADWLEEIAQALSYVHAKQMVHCDLKPANVLLDDEKHVRVADFGHSRILSESGSSLGTLFFMAPEQAMDPDPNKPLQPDVRWDIYAFGCTAYALLSGRVPHEEISGELEKCADIGGRLRIYRDAIEMQAVPELYLATKGRVDKDLSAIIRRCMETDPGKRYLTAVEILKDLKNRREGRPVSPLAHDPGYWMGKFLTRNRTSAIIAGIGLLVALAALAVISTRQRTQVQSMAFNYVPRGREFLEKGDEASAVAYFAASNKIYPSLLARGNALLHLPPVPNSVFVHDGPLVTVVFSPGGKTFLTASGASGARLWNTETNRPLGRFLKGEGLVTAAAYDPDGTRIALGDSTGGIWIIDASNGKTICKPAGQEKEITSVCFSSDGRKVLTASTDGSACLWNASTGESLKPYFNQKQPLVTAQIDTNGDRVLTAGKDGFARIWKVGDGGLVGDPIPLDISDAPAWYEPDVSFSPDGKTILTTGWNGEVRFYDGQGRHLGRNLFLGGKGAKALFSPNGRQILASAVYQETVGVARVFNLKTRAPLKYSLRNQGKILVLAFSGDGKKILTGADHVVRLWNAATGQPYGRPLWHGDTVTVAALNRTGDVLLTGSRDGLARSWDLAAELAPPSGLAWKSSGRDPFKKSQVHALLSHDGEKLLTYGGRTACLWDAAKGRAEGAVIHTGGALLRAVFSPDDKSLLTCEMDNQARLWDLSNGQFVTLPHAGAVRDGAFSQDGEKVVTGGDDRTLKVWEARTGTAWSKPLDTGVKIAKVLLSPDGGKVAVLSANGSLKLYPVKKAGARPLLEADRSVGSAAFSPDSKTLLGAVGSNATLWDAASGKPLRVLKHGRNISSILIDPDSKTMVTIGSDGTTRLWNPATGESIGNLLKHEGPVQASAFSPYGSTLLLVYQTGNWQLWDTKTAEPIGGETPLGTLAETAGFTAGARTLRILGRDGHLFQTDTFWIDPDTNPDKLLAASQVAGLCRVDSKGSVEPVGQGEWLRLWAQYHKNPLP
jgi:WD40 repeat protein/serine/threonine protein kinase